MLYKFPILKDEDVAVLQLIEDQRRRLGVYTEQSPSRWIGSLRRSTFARAIQGSNSIEGYHASMEDAIAAVENETPADSTTETWFAIKGYRDALTYIMQAARDPFFDLSAQFLKSLHFMMLSFDMKKNPGQWRPGPIFVVDERTGKKVYEAPPAEQVDFLVAELIEMLKSDHAENNLVRAALAHLNFTMIHPFRDGNGRMARALQTLVLAQDGVLHPLFSGIEEWLGRNTQAYYDMLAETGRGGWNPGRDALPWVRFCLKAHFQQAALLLRRNDEYGIIFEQLEPVIAKAKLPDRVAVPLFNVALGFRITNSRYRADVDVSEVVASRDLKKLCELGLLEPRGERRGRTYGASKRLKALRDSVRTSGEPENPYDLVRKKSGSAGI